MKTKKFLAVVLSVIMLLSSAPLGGFVGLDLPDLFKTEASAADYYNGFIYEINSGEVTITGYDESSETVVIPSTIDGYPVTSIGDWAFSDCNSLTSVTIPNSVTSIGENAFYCCGSLTSIEIPDSVTSIGNGAFEYCDNLTSVEIPDSVTSIGESAFAWCRSLTSISVSEENEYYSSDSSGVLYNKDKTILIQYPAGNRRTSFIIPNSATSIGENAFYCCDSLTSVEIPDSVTSIGDYAFYWCDSLTSVKIGNSVTSIGDSAFEWCTSLTSVTIPDSVTSIGEMAFGRCESLTSIAVTVTNENYSSDSNGVLYNKDKTILIQYPAGNRRTSFIIPDSVTIIGNYAFYYCTSLTSVTIGNRVTTIGEFAFYNCTSLTSVTIPDSVTSIGLGVFEYCRNLTSIEIPDSVTSIGTCAFQDCRSLASVTIPDSVTSIGWSAFQDCTSLTSVTIGNSVTSIGSGAFEGCTSLTSVEIPDSVTSIGSGAFEGCTSLTNIRIPASVTKIGRYAFGYGEKLNSIEGFVIYGYKNTAAEKYANENGFEFVALDDTHTHTFGEWSVVTPATCLNAGTEERACTGCEEKETREITKLTHSYTGEVKANNDGTHSFKCVNGCSQYGESEAHTGMSDFVCDKCGYTDTAAKALFDAKAAAKQTVDNAAGSSQSAEMQKIVSETKTDIDNAKTTEEVENAKKIGLVRIDAQKQAEKPVTNVCPKCGKEHADNFWGKIACFFNRIGNWFRNLFK